MVVCTEQLSQLACEHPGCKELVASLHDGQDGQDTFLCFLADLFDVPNKSNRYSFSESDG